MKNLDKKYWVGICPPAEIVDTVATLKQELKQQIGWYHSVNSKAHITFCEFYDTMGRLEMMENYLNQFCSSLEGISVRLNHAERLHKAYCLYPDEITKQKLIQLMRSFHKHKPFPTETKSLHPHLSIARQLTDKQLLIADSLFGNRIYAVEFVCNDITIRKFNPEKGQYDVFKEFSFSLKV